MSIAFYMGHKYWTIEENLATSLPFSFDSLCNIVKAKKCKSVKEMKECQYKLNNYLEKCLLLQGSHYFELTKSFSLFMTILAKTIKAFYD